MQDAIPYRTWSQSQPLTNQNNLNSSGIKICGDDLKRMLDENALVVFALRRCCLSLVVRCLLHRLGANTSVYEVEEEKDLNGVVQELEKADAGGGLQFPAVFIGGRLFGGLDRIMGAHITGELIPLLKKAGAL